MVITNLHSIVYILFGKLSKHNQLRFFKLAARSAFKVDDSTFSPNLRWKLLCQGNCPGTAISTEITVLFLSGTKPWYVKPHQERLDPNAASERYTYVQQTVLLFMKPQFALCVITHFFVC